MKTSVQCPLCASLQIQVVDQFLFKDLRHLYFESCEVDIAECLHLPYEESFVHLYRCGNCGLESYPTELWGTQRLYDALGRFDYYYVKDKWEFDLALEDAKEAESILEVGCGPGLFIDRVRSLYPTKQVKGLEVSQSSVQACRERGLDVESDTLEEFTHENEGRFDLVCAFQVLEHMPHPAGFLESAFRCLRAGGLFIVTVPNASGFTQHAINDFGNMPPHHISRWTADVMRSVAVMQSATLERIQEAPVAEYHKEWYRDTLTVRAVSRTLGLHWRRIERGVGYRLMLSVCRRLQRMIPATLWRYRSYPGHTLYAKFRKSASDSHRAETR